MSNKFVVFMIFLILISFILSIYVAFMYGGKPVSEVPLWVLWIINN